MTGLANALTGLTKALTGLLEKVVTGVTTGGLEGDSQCFILDRTLTVAMKRRRLPIATLLRVRNIRTTSMVIMTPILNMMGMMANRRRRRANPNVRDSVNKTSVRGRNVRLCPNIVDAVD